MVADIAARVGDRYELLGGSAGHDDTRENS